VILGNVIDEELKEINAQFQQPQYPPPPPPPDDKKKKTKESQSPYPPYQPYYSQGGPAKKGAPYPQYQGPPPPLHMSYYQFYSRKALQVMFIAIILVIASSIIYAISFFIISSMNNENSITDMMLLLSAVSIPLIAGGLLFFFFLLAVISIVLFKVDEFYFGERHKKNVKWAIFFTIIFVILYVGYWVINVWYAFAWPSITALITIFSIRKTLWIIQTLLIIFIVFLPVSALCGRNEKDKMYLFATGIIAVVVLRSIVDLFSIDNQGLNESGIAFTYGILYLIEAGFWTIAFLAYRTIWRWTKEFGRDIPRETRPFLPRPRPIEKPLYNFYSKPVQALTVIFIIGIILGAAEAASLMHTIGLEDTESDSGDNEDYYDYFDGSPGSFYDSGTLEEGQSEEIRIFLDLPIISLQASLTWSDEDDQFPRENQPDYFSMAISCANIDTYEQASNEHGGMGMIYLEVEDVDDEIDSYADITITLESAGDQTGPRGIPYGPWVIEDNENFWELSVEYY